MSFLTNKCAGFYWIVAPVLLAFTMALLLSACDMFTWNDSESGDVTDGDEEAGEGLGGDGDSGVGGDEDSGVDGDVDGDSDTESDEDSEPDVDSVDGDEDEDFEIDEDVDSDTDDEIDDAEDESDEEIESELDEELEPDGDVDGDVEFDLEIDEADPDVEFDLEIDEADPDVEDDPDVDTLCSCFSSDVCCDGCHPKNQHGVCGQNCKWCESGSCVNVPSEENVDPFWQCPLCQVCDGSGGCRIADDESDPKCECTESACTYETCHDGSCNMADGIECNEEVECAMDRCEDGICIEIEPDDLLCNSDGNSQTHDACDEVCGCYDAGWALSFGGDYSDSGHSVTHLADGGIAITGWFSGTVDFDPGEGVDEHTSFNNTYSDIFISIFNADGSYRWSETFGGLLSDGGWDIVQLTGGDLALTGNFIGMVDFDPGSGVDEHGVGGAVSTGVFVSVFGVDGTYRWTRTFGGIGSASGEGITRLADGGLALTGHFQDVVDFDTGSGTDHATSEGGADVFISVFDADGNYRWSRTFGGDLNDEGIAITQLVDSGIALTGFFQETVDFDPGLGVDESTSNGYDDVFVSVFEINGDYRWSHTFGATLNDNGNAIDKLADGGLVLSGKFKGTVDFNPEVEVAEFVSNENSADIFVSVFDADGTYRWSRAFGGVSNDNCFAVEQISDGGLALAGYFEDIVDFDPSVGMEEHVSNGDEDIFISVLDVEGNYLWSRTFGDTFLDRCFGVTQSVSNGIVLTGFFADKVDFDPGAGVDEHTSNGDNDIFLLSINPPPECK